MSVPHLASRNIETKAESENQVAAKKRKRRKIIFEPRRMMAVRPFVLRLPCLFAAKLQVRHGPSAFVP
jgi:hypothetical protein